MKFKKIVEESFKRVKEDVYTLATQVSAYANEQKDFNFKIDEELEKHNKELKSAKKQNTTLKKELNAFKKEKTALKKEITELKKAQKENDEKNNKSLADLKIELDLLKEELKSGIVVEEEQTKRELKAEVVESKANNKNSPKTIDINSFDEIKDLLTTQA